MEVIELDNNNILARCQIKMPPKRTTRASTTPKKDNDAEKNDKTPVKKAKFENSWMFLSKGNHD